MKHFPASELMINDDGSVFHLHLRPEQLADKVILVGDPARVDTVASHFDSRECEVSNREFHSITGSYHGKRLTVVSHGIGTDNIDIVLNELDALANIDFATREERASLRSLTLVRIGTSGGLQPHVPIGTYVISEKSIGFDGVLNFYAGRDRVSDLAFERAFCNFVRWHPQWAAPYVVDADRELGQGEVVRGVTISANGFYGPQGRELRLPLAVPDLNRRIEAFSYEGKVVTNYEMESSALAGLAHLMGHHAMTVCCIIANRRAGEANVGYKGSIEGLIEKVLQRI